jgi:hypothetical protein
MDAPSSPTSSGFNYALIGTSPQFYQLDPGRAFLQTVGAGALGGAAIAGGVTVTPVIVNAVKGPALGALMELTGTYMDTNAARTVTSIITTEGYPEFLEGMEEAGAIFRSLEVPEAAGPEVPWGPQ